MVPLVVPEVVPLVVPEVVPVVVPEVVPLVVPEVVPLVVPEVVPLVVPEVEPVVVPDVLVPGGVTMGTPMAVPVSLMTVGSATNVETTSLYSAAKLLKTEVSAKVPLEEDTDKETVAVIRSTPSGTLWAKAVKMAPICTASPPPLSLSPFWKSTPNTTGGANISFSSAAAVPEMPNVFKTVTTLLRTASATMVLAGGVKVLELKLLAVTPTLAATMLVNEVTPMDEGAAPTLGTTAKRD